MSNYKLIINNNPLYYNHSLGEWRNIFAFAAIKTDGSVVTWGYADYGGDSSEIGRAHV